MNCGATANVVSRRVRVRMPMPRLRLLPTHPSYSAPCTRADTAATRRKLLPKLRKIYDAKILYEDRGIVALDKPPGLITQSSAGDAEGFGKDVSEMVRPTSLKESKLTQKFCRKSQQRLTDF